MSKLSVEAKITLRQKLDEYFNEEELQTLCFDLGVEYGNLPAQSKAAKARELVALMQRQGRMDELVAAVARQRPNVEWQSILNRPGEAATPDAESSSLLGQEQDWLEDLTHGGGQVIITNVGAGASGVAIGKTVTQTNVNVRGDAGPDDDQVLEKKLADLAAAFERVRAQAGAATGAMFDFQINLLRGELSKTKEGQFPSAGVIIQVGEWMLDNAPQIKPALAGLFATPAANQVVNKAGEGAAAWVKARLG